MATIKYLCIKLHGRFYRLSRHCFGRVHELTLTQALGLRHGLPSHVTIREVLQRIPQSDLTHAFCAWSMDLEEGSEEWYSGDGKVLGSTVSDVLTKHQSSEGVGSIFAQKSGLVKCLGSYRNEEKQKGEPHPCVDRVTGRKGGGFLSGCASYPKKR